jgi:mannose-6-phosphate isomerase-like protein (cupin superfamily)
MVSAGSQGHHRIMAKIALHDALRTLSNANEKSTRFLERQEFDVGLYRPGASDDQTPHKRDEIYVITSGTGTFVCGSECYTFQPGDAFFVEAGVEHRFENFTEEFSSWVIFFGART